MAETDVDERIAAVRGFNRFYTQKIGVLDEGLLQSPYSLTEVRVLYELAHRQQPTARELATELGLDEGYLSRILRGFKKRGLIGRKRSDADSRSNLLWLTVRGRQAFGPLDRRSQDQVRAMLVALPAAEQERVVQAMDAIQTLLGARPSARVASRTPYLLRPHRPGDIGWVVHRHGAVYASEYGWDERFEALVATIAARFVQRYDPKRERCWIAEKDGEIVGSVFLVRQSQTVAKLRLLLVEPKARGLGIGARLVEECIHFARHAGYRKIVLWTNDVLHAARRLYERAGFRLVHEEAHRSFGHDLIGQTWELKL